MRKLLCWVLLAACGGSDDPPLTDAVALACPTPGNLPFRLESKGWQSPDNATLVMNQTRNKDEGADTLGVPGGKLANVYVADTSPAAAGSVVYAGRKARTLPTNGLFSNPLAGENVSLWTYDSDAWVEVGRTMTDQDGLYAVDAGGMVAANGQPVYAMLEADGSCAAQYTYLYPAGEKVIVVDIDGTLTTADSEFDMQLPDASYQPKMMGAADKLTQAWAAKHYPIVYLTARPHTVREESRAWLDALKFPTGPLITAVQVEEASAYKTAWLKRMVTDFGWNIVAAYGNATTDITAYANVHVPLEHTFIVGPEGGMGGTVAIPNLDFTAHIESFVKPQPDNL